MNEAQNNNPLIRFLDDSVTDTLKNIKETAKQSLEDTAKLKKTLTEAQIRITQLLSEL